MRKACAECGEEFEAKREAATYCSGRCTKRAQRRPGSQNPPVSPLRSSVEPAPGPVAASTQSELEQARREGSAAGQSALALARRIDAGSGETGSGMAALVREHRVALAEALKDAESAADPLDELKARRDSKRAG